MVRQEIACDESGAEGEKLLDGNTDVFAHASVRLSTEAADNCVREIRDRIRSPASVYKSNHLLREKSRPVLTWLLGPSGPVSGNAHVLLADKTFLLISKLTGLIADDETDAAGTGLCQDQRAKAMAVTLYRDGQGKFGAEKWHAFLESFNDLMRAKNGRSAQVTIDSFFRMVDVLRLSSAPDRAGMPDRAGEIMELLWQSRPRAAAFFRVQPPGSPRMIPALDPLVPAIVAAVAYWSAGSVPVSVVHDRQTALTDERIAQLREICGGLHSASRRHPPVGQLASLRLVDSSSDSRVQVADFLAGVARKIASDELGCRGDAELTALLRPYVDAFSIWGDDRSWSLLGPMPGHCAAGLGEARLGGLRPLP